MKNRGFFPVCLSSLKCAVSIMLMGGATHAASVTWDSDVLTPGIQDGSGTWDASTSTWWNGTADVAWPNTTADIAVFGGASGAAGSVSVSGTVTLNKIQFNAAGSGNYTLGGGTLDFGGTSPSIAFAAAPLSPVVNSLISGNGGITYNGNSSSGATSSTITLGGANTYTGLTTIQKINVNFNLLDIAGNNSSFGTSGNVSLGTASSACSASYTGTVTGTTDRLWVLGGTGSSVIANNGSAAISFTNTGSIVSGTAGNRALTLGGTNAGANTFAELIANATGFVTTFTKNGAGSWTLANTANSYTGVTALAGGNLYVSKLDAGGNTSCIGAATSAAANLLFNGGALNYTGSGDSCDRLFTLAAAATINNNGTGPLNWNASGTILHTNTLARTLTLGGTYAGSANTMAATIADGTGGTAVTTLRIGNVSSTASTWNITGNNTHTGGTTLNASGALLNIANTGALGSGPLIAGANGSFDNTTGSDLTVSNALTLSGGSPTYAGSANNMTINGAVTISGANRTITVSARTLILGGAIGEDATPRNFTKAGSTGTLVLAGAMGSTYSGATTITGGTLAITAANNLGTGTSINLSTSNTATLALAAAATGTVQIPATTTITTTTITGNLGNLAGTSTVFDIAAKITGTGNVNRSSGGISTTGAVRFSNDASDFSGTFNTGFGLTEFTSVANSGAASSLGAGSSAYSIGNSTSSATFRYVGTSSTSTNRNIDWKATTGGLAIENNGTGTVKFLGTANFVSGVGAKTLTLGGNNTGDNEVAQVMNQAASGITAAAAAFSTGATIVKLTSVDGVATGAAISGTGIDAGTTIASINTGTREVTLSTPAIGAGTSGQAVTVAGVVNTTSLIKTGTCKWILSGSNAFTGNTTVNGGTLSLGTATLDDASAISIAGGATLELTHAATDTVNELYFNGVQQSPGTYNAANSGGRVTGTGSLLVTSGPAPSNTYATWIAGFPGAAGAPGFNQDADGDGITNGVEHVLGTDPSSSTSGLVQVSSTGTSVKFRHTLTNDPASDVTHSYQWSTDLANWHASGATNAGGTTATISSATITDNTAPANDLIEVTATVTGGPSNRIFARLAATQP